MLNTLHAPPPTTPTPQPQEYVCSRLLQFIKRFGVSLAQQLPGVTAAVLDRAVHDTVRALPLPDYGQVGPWPSMTIAKRR
jgi:hypothetical protein